MPEEIHWSRPEDEAALRDVLGQHDRVVVAFHAAWSDRCQQLERDLATVDGFHFAVVDVQASPLLAYQYDVTHIPTLVRFENGEAVDRQEGVPDDVGAFLGVGRA